VALEYVNPRIASPTRYSRWDHCLSHEKYLKREVRLRRLVPGRRASEETPMSFTMKQRQAVTREMTLKYKRATKKQKGNGSGIRPSSSNPPGIQNQEEPHRDVSGVRHWVSYGDVRRSLALSCLVLNPWRDLFLQPRRTLLTPTARNRRTGRRDRWSPSRASTTGRCAPGRTGMRS